MKEIETNMPEKGVTGLKSSAVVLGSNATGWTLNQTISEVHLPAKKWDDCAQDMEKTGITVYTTLLEIVQRLKPGLKERRVNLEMEGKERERKGNAGKLPVDCALFRLFLTTEDLTSPPLEFVSVAHFSLRQKISGILSTLTKAMEAIYTDNLTRTYSIGKYAELPPSQTDFSDEIEDSVSPSLPIIVRKRSRMYSLSVTRLASVPLSSETLTEHEELQHLQSLRSSEKQHRPSLSVDRAMERTQFVPLKKDIDLKKLKKGLANVRKMERESNKLSRNGDKKTKFPVLRTVGQGR